MEPGEALGIAAQIAVALAGFAGVVVVFRREAVHEWSGIDKLRLRLLLANSIVPLGLSMLGLLLLSIKPVPLEIWRWCSAMTFLGFLTFVVTTRKRFRRLNLQEVQRERGIRLVLYFSERSGWQPCSCRRSTLRCLARSGRFSLQLCTKLS